ncbi:MAG TPA: GGDEF domain-containing protein [Devosia sp.]|nr:GGDEF domain-containing protein [Devosia sp.]
MFGLWRSENEELPPWVERQLTQALFASLPTVGLMTAAAAIAGGVSFYRTHDLLLGLAAIGAAAFGALRVLFCWLFARAQQAGPVLGNRSWTALYAGIGAAFSLCLGMMGGRALFFDDMLPNLLMTTTGTAYVFAVIVRASVPRVALWMIVFVFVPLVVAGALVTDRAYLGFSALMALFCVASLELAGHVGSTVRARLMAEHKLWREVRTDHLTGLANRAGVQTHGEEIFGQTDRGEVIVALVDLDGFKQVNDTHGHAAGDELLRQVGERLKALLGGRHFAARLGGDEFLVIFEADLSYEDAIETADRIVYSIRRPFEIDGTEITVSASIGLAPSLKTDGALSAVLGRADEALYRAKTDGKDQAKAYCPRYAA